MATNHIAIMRMSARMAQQKIDAESRQNSEQIHAIDCNSNDTVISVSDDEYSTLKNQPSESSGTNISQKIKHNRHLNHQRNIVAPLGQLKTVQDIEQCVDEDLQQLNVLNRLEQKWFEISSNLEQVLDHLQDCSSQVTTASTRFLETLDDSVNLTCDKVDVEIKALRTLMSKCDEVATKLVVAGSFCDEIKTLRKSIETLEHLYKIRPQQVPSQRL